MTKRKKQWTEESYPTPGLACYVTEEATRCPSCGAPLDGAMNIGDRAGAPRAGSYGICVTCHVYLRYVSATTLRVLGNQEWEAIPLEERIRLVQLRKAVQAISPPKPGEQ